MSLLLLWAALALAQAQAPAAERGPLAFANHLFETGDDYRAIGEYERYLFEHPDGAERDEAQLRIGLAYLHGERYAEAATYFDQLAQESEALSQRDLYAFEATDARYLDGDFGVAAAGFASLRAGAETPPLVRARARYLEGWALLFAHRDAAARLTFQEASADPLFGERARRVAAHVRSESDLPHRNPVLSGILSAVVPGAGYVYLGQPAIAAAALAWNGLFGVGVADAAIHRLWGITAVLGVFEAMWYGGAIFGSVSGAYKFNRDAWRNYVDALKAEQDWRGDAQSDDPVAP